MKILIVGASGMVGAENLKHCLARADVSRVVAFVRRELSAEQSGHPKLEVVRLEDFALWPEPLLEAHADAAGMIWCMGSYSGDRKVDLEYSLAFVEGMGRVLERQPDRPPFKYVHLSGTTVPSNPEQSLWWGEAPRRLKSLADASNLEFAENHPALWKTYIVKPGAIGGGPRFTPGISRNWVTDTIAGLTGVQISELAAFMTYLATDGRGEEAVTENGRIARRSKELLRAQED